MERPLRLVRLGRVLAVASFSLSLAAWFYRPGGLFFYVTEFIRPLLRQYTGAACGSALPLAAVALGLWAAWRGRRECGTLWFIIAIASVLLSCVLVSDNFAVIFIIGNWDIRS